MKCLASFPKGSAGTSFADADDAASLCADVKGARPSVVESPFCSVGTTSVAMADSAAALLPADGAW